MGKADKRIKKDEAAAHERAIENAGAVVRAVIGGYIRHMRLVAGLNQKDLGKQGTVSQMERGEFNGGAAKLVEVLTRLAGDTKNTALNARRAKRLAELYVHSSS
ncbi:MAG: hypothetical protein IT371_04640 [Deltaproteobacteria bacterium]|nr:hypothetical protein [Deltaproteobacteria bacterium]